MRRSRRGSWPRGAAVGRTPLHACNRNPTGDFRMPDPSTRPSTRPGLSRGMDTDHRQERLSRRSGTSRPVQRVLGCTRVSPGFGADRAVEPPRTTLRSHARCWGRRPGTRGGPVRAGGRSQTAERRRPLQGGTHRLGANYSELFRRAGLVPGSRTHAEPGFVRGRARRETSVADRGARRLAALIVASVYLHLLLGWATGRAPADAQSCGWGLPAVLLGWRLLFGPGLILLLRRTQSCLGISILLSQVSFGRGLALLARCETRSLTISTAAQQMICADHCFARGRPSRADCRFHPWSVPNVIAWLIVYLVIIGAVGRVPAYILAHASLARRRSAHIFGVCESYCRCPELGTSSREETVTYARWLPLSSSVQGLL